MQLSIERVKSWPTGHKCICYGKILFSFNRSRQFCCTITWVDSCHLSDLGVHFFSGPSGFKGFCQIISCYSFRGPAFLSNSIFLYCSFQYFLCSVFLMFSFRFYLFSFHVCFLNVCLGTMCMQCPQRPEKGIESLETGVTEDCEPSCGCQDLNPGHPEEQLVLLTEPLIQT